MPLQFDINSVINIFENEKQQTTPFSGSLRTILSYIQTDNRINDIKEAAYLLGTAAVESNYSLQRWESDYVCKLYGKSYGNKGPCNAALSYYRSTDGKLNYYTLGTDSRGFPYFGRGLIQLTGKANYKTFGEILGIDLVGNGDLALEPRNSYDIAVEYMSRKRKGHAKSTFEFAKSGQLKEARATINARDASKVAVKYNLWLSILKELESAVTQTTLIAVNGETNQPIPINYSFVPSEEDPTENAPLPVDEININTTLN
jgi:hypothetical protein